jgi:hypothetical protein
MTFLFEILLVDQKSVDFADAVCARAEAFPRGYGFLVDQLNRATRSTRPPRGRHVGESDHRLRASR